MLLFSLVSHKHKLTFKKLSNCMEHLTTAATWAENEWGYVRNKGVAFREDVFRKLSDDLYIAHFRGLPVGMFALVEKETSPELLTNKHDPSIMFELRYVYVDKNYRSLGFGNQIIEKAKLIAKHSGANLIVLDTLKPNLNRFYQKHDAQILCEGQLFSHGTDVLSMKL
jgi:diamine N-acetyltransferase